MAKPRVRLALIKARYALFLAMGTERPPEDTSTPESRACLVEEIPKPFSCQPEHTVRAMPRVVAMKRHFEGDRSIFELPKRVEHFNRWLAESVHNLSCRAFRAHLEIINKTEKQLAWGIYGGGRAGPYEATLWPDDLLGKILPPSHLKQVSGRCGVRRLSEFEVTKTLAPATIVGCVGNQAPCMLVEQNQINTVIDFLKIDEQNASTDSHYVCCLHHETGVDGGPQGTAFRDGSVPKTMSRITPGRKSSP